MPKLQVHFIDTQKMTDAILLDMGETEILIDAGHSGSNVARYIEKYVDGELDAIIVSHPHANHLGGFIEILQKYTVKEIWANGDARILSKDLMENAPRVLTFYENLHKSFKINAKKENASLNIAIKGKKITVGNLIFDVLHPQQMHGNSEFTSTKTAYQELDNNSIVLRLRYGNVSFLFTGDILHKGVQELLATNSDIHSDILKVPHHCSAMSSPPDFIQKVAPKVAICTGSGKKIEQGQIKPHPDTMAAYEKNGATVYSTGEHGNIIITTTGSNFTADTVR